MKPIERTLMPTPTFAKPEADLKSELASLGAEQTSALAELRAEFPCLFSTNPEHQVVMYGLQCGRGWMPLVRGFCDALQRLNDPGSSSYRIVQVKSKLGSLRIHTVPRGSEVGLLRMMADEMSKYYDETTGLAHPKRKVLFLDFDGVLHPTSGDLSNSFVRAQQLADALSGLNCEVVISSSWRHHWTLDELLEKLPPALADRVIGTTGSVFIGHHARMREIEAWLRDAPGRSVNSWRALDDCEWEFPPKQAELIVCNPNTGVTDQELGLLRHWLDPRT